MAGFVRHQRRFAAKVSLDNQGDVGNASAVNIEAAFRQLFASGLGFTEIACARTALSTPMVGIRSLARKEGSKLDGIGRSKRQNNCRKRQTVARLEDRMSGGT